MNQTPVTKPTVQLDITPGTLRDYCIRFDGDIKYGRDTVLACVGAVLNMLGNLHIAKALNGGTVRVKLGR